MFIDQSSGYYFNKLILIRDPENSNTINDINISGDANLIVVEIDYEFIADPGDNVSIKIKADYSMWFNNLDMDNLSVEEISTNIVSLTSSAFSAIE